MAVCPGVNTLLSAVMERSCRGQDFIKKKQCSSVETKVKVAGRHPSEEVREGRGDAYLDLSTRR